MKGSVAVVLAAGCVSACATTDTRGYGTEPTIRSYTEPSQSGLIGVRPYPNADDVCVVVGENSLTADLLDDAALLIGCPKHEQGAIADRQRDGARVVGQAKHWTLLSVPQG